MDSILNNVNDNSNVLFLVVDPSADVGSTLGHYNAYDSAILKMASASGLNAHLICQKSKNENLDPCVHPYLSHDVWGNYLVDEINNVVNPKNDHNPNIELRSAINDCIKVTNSRQGVIFFPNSVMDQLKAACDIANDTGENFTQVHLLRYHSDLYEYNLSSENIKEIIKLIDSGDLILVTDSALLSQELSTVFKGRAISNIGVPDLLSEISNKEIAIKNKTRIGTLGAPRGEKGFSQILFAVEKMRDFSLANGIEFHLQANNPSEECVSQLEKFDETLNPHVVLIKKSLSSEEYIAHLNSMDLVLLPYSPAIYSGRTSGALVECLYRGIPTLVTKGTWLEYIQSQLGLEASLDFENVDTLIIGIKAYLTNRDQIHINFRNAQKLAVELFSQARIWNELLAAIPILAKPTIGLFYPWGAESIYSSGSGSRILAISKYITEQGLQPVIYTSGTTRVQIFGQDTVPLPLMKSLDKNIHLAFHNAVIENNDESLRDEIRSHAGLVFEGTHLVDAVLKFSNYSDSTKIIITSQDILSSDNENTNKKLLDCQINALSKGRAFSLSPEELVYWKSFSIDIHLSLPLIPSYFDNLIPFLDLDSSTGFLDHNDNALFVGSHYQPNIDAVEFLKSVAEALSTLNSEIQILVVGGVAKPEFSPNYRALGKVSSLALELIYKRSFTALAPIYKGTGIAIKSIEALIRNGNLIASPLAVRGLDLNNLHGLHVVPGVKPSKEVYIEIIKEVFSKKEISNSDNVNPAFNKLYQDYDFIDNIIKSQSIKPIALIPQDKLLIEIQLLIDQKLESYPFEWNLDSINHMMGLKIPIEMRFKILLLAVVQGICDAEDLWLYFYADNERLHPKTSIHQNAAGSRKSSSFYLYEVFCDFAVDHSQVSGIANIIFEQSVQANGIASKKKLKKFNLSRMIYRFTTPQIRTNMVNFALQSRVGRRIYRYFVNQRLK